ncbi:MAG: HAMP domain-containing histidine kinase [Candidatus Eremiobacteraeota bacterium]|nr:HAMP domain-containing histidine kinase [Candidatus Eremiobacteraeota bacterium]
MYSAGRPPLRKVLSLSHSLMLFLCLVMVSCGVYFMVTAYLFRAGEFRLISSVVEGLHELFPEHRSHRRFFTPNQGSPHEEKKPRRFERPTTLVYPEGLESRGQQLVDRISTPGTFAMLYSDRGQLIAKHVSRRFGPRLEKLPEEPAFESFLLREGDREWQAVLVPLESDSGRATLVVGTIWNPSRDLLRALATYQLMVGVFILIMVLLFSRALAARLARPVEELSQFANRVAAGDFTVRAPAGCGDSELDRLARTFNSMVRRLDESFSAQRRFVADASHELKTPLTSIRGMAEMLRRGAANDPTDRELALATIEREVDRMSLLVTDLLALSKAEHLPMQDAQPVDLTALLQEFTGEARLECPAGMMARAHPEPLRRVIRNLVDNAHKYSPEEGSVSIAVQAVAEGVEIRVEDSGIGIEPEDLERVFDRFYRTDPARARDTGGTGLGLSIVAALVERMGGRVWLESQKGAGTRAIVVLPGP